MDKKKTVNLDLKQYGMMIALVAVYLIFAVFESVVENPNK